MKDRLTETEISMILDTYMYFDYQNANDGESLSEIMEGMRINHQEVIDSHPNEYAILSQAVSYDEVGKLKISCQSVKMGYNDGTRGACFESEDKNTIYVALRGTADGEWLDNGYGMTEEMTTQQEEAVKYFDEVVLKHNITSNQRLITTGHSKGGNKVQYITMDSKNSKLIDKCYSIDGQGHSEKAINKWKEKYTKEEYDDRVSKIYGINGQNDFVSVLGNSVILSSHVFLVETPSETNDYAAYHDITRMFGTLSYDENENACISYSPHKNKYVLRRGILGEYVSSLSDDIMKLDPNIRDGCATTLMQTIEILNKGRWSGLGHEHATKDDLLEFFAFGTPVIFKSLVMGPKGTKLINSIRTKEGFVPTISKDVILDINYMALENMSSLILDTSKKLLNQVQEFSDASSRMHISIKGSEYKKQDLTNASFKLFDIGKKLEGISSLQSGIATRFKNVDTGIIS